MREPPRYETAERLGLAPRSGFVQPFGQADALRPAASARGLPHTLGLANPLPFPRRFRSNMTSLLSLLPLAFMPLLFALLVKVAAFLLRRTTLSWKHALVFGLLALAVGAIGTVTNLASGRVLPPLLTGLVGIAIQVAVGGWYFGPRARTTANEPVGFVRGMLLSLIAFGIVFVLGVVAAVLIPALQHASQP